MKLLLCSDFSGVGYRFIGEFLKETKGLTCLFVGYAEEDEAELESGAATRFKDMGMNVISLQEGFDFATKIDVVFVRGGNTTRLVHLLRKYDQYDKIKKLAESGVLYVGNSAGSVLAGSDTEWTLEAEPYEPDLKPLFGKDALKGFGWVDKLVFVHTSRHRLCWKHERKNEDDIFRTIDRENYPAYLKDVRKYSKSEFIKIANNEVYIENNGLKKFKKYNWKHLRLVENPLGENNV